MMPANGATKDYRFDEKYHWRKWMWNSVSKLQPHPHRAVVLYLAGSSDLDRPLALRKGFKSENLIAVEKDSRAVQELRKSGALTVDGNILDVALSWPVERPVGALLFDFCSGLELKIWKRLELALLRPPFWDAVFAFNLLRGRDASSNNERKDFITKHRGRILLSRMLWSGLFVYEKESNTPNALEEDAGAEALLALNKIAAPRMYSYKSGTLRFDSIVFRNPFGVLFQCPLPDGRAARRHFASEPFREYSESLLASGIAQKTRRRLAATFAHRTRRLRDGRTHGEYPA